jgi:hypothetical protein
MADGKSGSDDLGTLLEIAKYRGRPTIAPAIELPEIRIRGDGKCNKTDRESSARRLHGGTSSGREGSTHISD